MPANTTPTTVSYDCVVIGGGPSGSTVATLVAKHGHKVLVIERDKFPRFHIGESLMPETYWTFKRLGILEKMQNSHFVKKYSVQFANALGKESAPFYFDEMNPHECSQTWQVRRSEFDQMLLENAAANGADVWMETAVNEVLFESGNGTKEAASSIQNPNSKIQNNPGRAVGVTATRKDGTRVTVRAKVVVDATGNNALISRKLGLRQPDPQLRKAAVFAHYKGALREPDPRDEGATLVLHVHEQNGWFWYIPLHDDIVSVGVVGDTAYLTKDRKNPEKVLEEEIQKCPCLVPRMAKAERVGPVHVLSDFSYNSKVCAGDGWVLVGDAFTFLDPIYSSGVFLALKSGDLASDSIHDALVHNDFSAARLGKWGEPFYEGLQRIRALVYAFYSKGFSFGRFVRENPHFKRNLVELLIGDVFRPEAGQIFDTMQKYCKLPEPLKLDPSAVAV